MKTALIVLGVLAFLFLFISIASSQLKILTVTGNSMYPAITENDVVVVALAKNENSETLGVHEGDVITYTLRVDEKEVLMTHRIVGIERNNNEVHLSTKGDNLSGVDKYVVTPSQVGVNPC
jgi:signal peptidase I